MDDPEREFYWNLKAAEQGLAEAQNLVAQSFVFGFGCEKDKSKARKWYRKAAKQGVKSAQTRVEDMDKSEN